MEATHSAFRFEPPCDNSRTVSPRKQFIREACAPSLNAHIRHGVARRRRLLSQNLIDEKSVPTLIIHAQDDPFIPFAAFRHQDIETNPNIVLLAPEQGGHVGFVSADREGEERFWAEVMAVEFVKLLSS